MSAAPPHPTLWLVRHAQPTGDVVQAGLCYGRLDVPADPQASAVAAQALAQALVTTPTAPRRLVLRYSPLQRCELLAQHLCGLRPDLAQTIQPDPKLLELDFGAWEGRPWAHIARSEIDVWAHNLAHCPPGGGEPLSAMLARVASALLHAYQLAQHHQADVLWVSHAGVERCVRWLYQHQWLQHAAHRAPAAPLPPLVLPESAQWPQQGLGYGQWSVWAL